MTARVIVLKDNTDVVVKSIADLIQLQVLVGIPEDKSARQGGPITNAALGYIHEFGAPGANIPARPFLIPGIRKSQKEIERYLRRALAEALGARKEGDANYANAVDRARVELVRAGVVAENAAKNEITTGDFVPLRPATVAARMHSRGTQSQREGEKRYQEMVDSGMKPGAAQVAAGIRPLINTGALRRSITSVVRPARFKGSLSGLDNVQAIKQALDAK